MNAVSVTVVVVEMLDGSLKLGSARVSAMGDCFVAGCDERCSRSSGLSMDEREDEDEEERRISSLWVNVVRSLEECICDRDVTPLCSELVGKWDRRRCHP